MSVASWLDRLEADAPDVVAGWRALDPTPRGVVAMRRELRTRVHAGDAPRILAQQEAIGAALGDVLDALPDRLLQAPGGEEDWNVAQAFAHTTAGRRFLAEWAALDAVGEWPDAAPPVVTPSVPGRADADRAMLRALLDKSARSLRVSAGRIEGHETQACRLEHPLVGRLRCGDWLAFVGIHDLMHLEQMHALLAADASTAERTDDG